MSNRPQFWIVAGPNGAGKTTCVQRKPISDVIPGVTFLNPDDLTLSKIRKQGMTSFLDPSEELLRQLFIDSAIEVESQIDIAIQHSESIGVETVLSSEKYKRLVQDANQKKYFIGMIYVTLSTPEIAIDRVANRVKRGGHGIPSEKIEARFYRSHENLTWFFRNVTAFWIIDNSDYSIEVQPKMIAYGSTGTLEYLDPQAHVLIKQVLTN